MLTVDEIVARLKEIVGPRFVSTNPIDKINYQHTLAYGAYRALPDVIVRIDSDQQGNHAIAKILKFANEHKIPIVAKGGVGMGIVEGVKEVAERGTCEGDRSEVDLYEPHRQAAEPIDGLDQNRFRGHVDIADKADPRGRTAGRCHDTGAERCARP